MDWVSPQCKATITKPLLQNTRKMITKEDITLAQSTWAHAIVEIGKLKGNIKEARTVASQRLHNLYAFNRGPISFKPTKAAHTQFRPCFESALSYFIGDNNKYPEDKGFALQPWVDVEFDNKSMILEEERAIVMGNYFFTNKAKERVKVEYTFAYIKDKIGKLKIDLHHSSVPFAGE